jgi:predicted Rossmann-fold nucleotide-binding protein
MAAADGRGEKKSNGAQLPIKRLCSFNALIGSVRTELRSVTALNEFLAQGERQWDEVLVHNVDLAPFEQRLADENVSCALFLGCRMRPELMGALVARGATVFPHTNVPGSRKSSCYRSDLYTSAELYGNIKDPAWRWEDCEDGLMFRAFMHKPTPEAEWQPRKASLEQQLLRKLHDTFISDCLDSFLTRYLKPGCVGIMGGHAELRRERVKSLDGVERDATYMEAALLAKQLTEAGFLVATGGGPGVMEAGNLGAWFAGRTEEELRRAVRTLEKYPSFRPPASQSEWLRVAQRVCEEFPRLREDRGQSLSIPTFFYGHEPSNMFATHIAKFFENSVREDGLVTIAKAGIVFAPGKAGTVQEIFQDATQNFYAGAADRTPMVLWSAVPGYWEGGGSNGGFPAWQLLRSLASKKDFLNVVLHTESFREAFAFIARFHGLAAK